MNLFDVLFARKLAGGGSPFPPVIKRKTGNPIELTDAASAPLVKCVTDIQGYQDLHGYDKPWVGGAGKNKCNYTGVNNAIVASCLQGVTYTFSLNLVNGAGCNIKKNDSTGTLITTLNNEGYNYYTFTADEDFDLFLNGYNSFVANATNLQLEVGSTATAYAPYSNICPITAYTEGEIEVSDGDGNTTTHTTTYPSAIYRGSEDCVEGSVDIVRIKKSVKWSDGTSATVLGNNTRKRFVFPNTEYSVNNDPNAICNIAPLLINFSNDSLHFYISRDAAYIFLPNDTDGNTDIEFVYEFETHKTSSVTPTNLPIRTLSGYNHIESSTGDMVVDYITDAYQNFVDTTESALPNTRKGGSKAMDIFMTLDEPGDKDEPKEEQEAKEEQITTKK